MICVLMHFFLGLLDQTLSSSIDVVNTRVGWIATGICHVREYARTLLDTCLGSPWLLDVSMYTKIKTDSYVSMMYTEASHWGKLNGQQCSLK